MATVTLHGNPFRISGELPKTGTQAPDFSLTAADLKDVSLNSLKGSRIILNIFPSVDTGVCAMSVRKFNAEASRLKNTKVLCISRDLPFAFSRFCGAEGLKEVITLSVMRSCDFGRNYGVRITEGPMEGLLARSVVVLDESGKVLYTELVPEITQEPDYEKALAALS